MKTPPVSAWALAVPWKGCPFQGRRKAGLVPAGKAGMLHPPPALPLPPPALCPEGPSHWLPPGSSSGSRVGWPTWAPSEGRGSAESEGSCLGHHGCRVLAPSPAVTAPCICLPPRFWDRPSPALPLGALSSP